jgi:hypothetical protein
MEKPIPADERLLWEGTQYHIYLSTNQAYLGHLYVWGLRDVNPGTVLIPSEKEANELQTIDRNVRLAMADLWKPDSILVHDAGLRTHQCIHYCPRFHTKQEFAGESFEDTKYPDHEQANPRRFVQCSTFTQMRELYRNKFTELF